MDLNLQPSSSYNPKRYFCQDPIFTELDRTKEKRPLSPEKEEWKEKTLYIGPA